MEYQLAQDAWRDAEVISIFDPAGYFLLECPLMRRGSRADPDRIPVNP